MWNAPSQWQEKDYGMHHGALGSNLPMNGRTQTIVRQAWTRQWSVANISHGDQVSTTERKVSRRTMSTNNYYRSSIKHYFQLFFTNYDLLASPARRAIINRFDYYQRRSIWKWAFTLITKATCRLRLSKDNLHSSSYLEPFRKLALVGYYAVIPLNRSPPCSSLSFAAFKRHFCMQLLPSVPQ